MTCSRLRTTLNALSISGMPCRRRDYRKRPTFTIQSPLILDRSTGTQDLSPSRLPPPLLRNIKRSDSTRANISPTVAPAANFSDGKLRHRPMLGVRISRCAARYRRLYNSGCKVVERLREFEPRGGLLLAHMSSIDACRHIRTVSIRWLEKLYTKQLLTL